MCVLSFARKFRYYEDGKLVSPFLYYVVVFSYITLDLRNLGINIRVFLISVVLMGFDTTHIFKVQYSLITFRFLQQ